MTTWLERDAAVDIAQTGDAGRRILLRVAVVIEVAIRCLRALVLIVLVRRRSVLCAKPGRAHAVRGLAYGKDAEVWESPEIIFAAGATEGVSGDGEAAFDGQVRVHGIEGTVENSSGQLLGVVWRIFWHWRKYRRERADDEAQALTSLFCVLPQKRAGRFPPSPQNRHFVKVLGRYCPIPALTRLCFAL